VGGGNALDAKNPYQPVDVDSPHRRRSLILIISAGLGSILALIVLNLAVQPSRPSPATELELAPASPVIGTNTTTAPSAAPVSSAPVTSGAPTFVATLPSVSVAPTTSIPGAPSSTVTAPPRWMPPDTPDFVRAVVLDNESLDVVAPYAGATMAYIAVSRPGSAACGGAVYRVEQGQPRELVSSTRYLFPRGDGRWVVLATVLGTDCRPATLTIVDTINETTRELPAHGWFNRWSSVDVRFVLYDYLLGYFTLYDGPSATSQRLSVSPSFVGELDGRTGPGPQGRPGWMMGRVSFLADGELVAHIQCQVATCANNDSISGWFYVVDGQVSGESQRVPLDKAPQESFYCGV
jgi:hypothetical protein